MKASKHVEKLLRQGRKRKELIELGFPKSVVTRVSRRLRQEKTAPRTKVPESPENVATQQKLPSTELPEVAVLVAAAQRVGTNRQEICRYERDGLCTLETWSSQEEVPQGMGEPVLIEKGKSEWYVKPSPFYCALCSASLEERINQAAGDAFDTPLWGARERITCSGCGSKGWIAVRIKCTKCGRETYWGWYS